MAESSAIATVGSKLKLLPVLQYNAWPTGTQVATSADGVTWGSYADVQMYEAADVEYPGYFKVKTDAAGAVNYCNYKTAAEATSIVGSTVVLGGVTTA